ncbi:pollen-specific leucine-rich repeat extensin-like protein 1 isoform X1 [Tanacetum coccineum]
MGKSLITLVAFLLVSISIGSTNVRAVDNTKNTPAPVPGSKYTPPPAAPVPAPKTPATPVPAPKALVPAPKTPAAPVPAPKAPAPAPKPKTPAPVPAPKTPAPAPKPKTPAPTPKIPAPAPKPKAPAPTPKPKTPVPAPKPKAPAPAPKPKTPAPAPKPKTPAPVPKPKTPTPAPKPKTPPPAPKPKTPAPAPKPKTPAPTPKPKTPAPVPAPKTPAPAPKPKTPPPAPKPKPVADEVNYDVLTPEPKSGSERVFCKSKGNCYYKTLTCPKECPERKPKKNKKNKGCHMNCGSKCEATCKWRRPKCNGYGSLCYDPRFVGGDGVMFYFHGGKGRDFALVSDTNLQINGHFIGSRPNGRKRDYTWVQSLSVMFDTQTLIISANKVAQWDDSVDVLSFKWNGEEVTVPFDGDSEWRTSTEEREVVVERTDDTNTVKVTVSGLVEIDMKAVPVTKEDDKAHNYQLPSNDAFAHFELQFKFMNLSDDVEGILGKTYQPGYVSPVKRGIAMPIMGGEEKYETASLTSTVCKECKFQTTTTTPVIGLSQY